jgi:hypothetical protein
MVGELMRTLMANCGRANGDADICLMIDLPTGK